ncbi:MAG: hypothetical protein J6A23_02915, partial [Thermoguttaceae bacterium]|nr:hypothetical protein [Thermoguttaceae bacterium]
VNSEIGLGADSRLTADEIRFLAETNGDLLTNLESGAGGGIDSSAGIVKMAWVPTAKISLAKNSAEFLSQAANNLEASRILLETNTKGTLDFINDSFRGGLVNGGGAGNDVQIRANSIQDLGNIRILAPNIQIQALTDLLKEKNRQNTYLASGGVIDVAAGTGNQFLAEVEALVNVGDFAKISTGNADRDGELSILAQNTLNAFDTYYLNSGGVICLTVGSSDFLVKKLNANVRIGEDADLFSSRDFSISALSGGEMYMELTANSYGVAGIPDGKGKMHVDSQNAVSIGKNAQLLSLGDMFLGAGSSPQGDSRWNIESIVNTFNGTAIPLSSTASNDYRFTLKNDIKIAENASLRSVSDISLLSMAGLVRSVAHSYAGNTYAGVSSSEISNIFSDGDGQLYRSDSMEGFVFQGGITTAGKIEAGIYADSRLSIDADGNVSGSDWISWEIEKDAALDQSFETEIQALEEEIRHFQSTGETAYLEALEAEKAQLEALQTMYVGKTADILKLDPIAAAGGDIIAHGNYFRTEGDSASLAANGQAKIEVSNDSAMFLQTNSMEIMGSGNGKFRFNSNQILSQDALNKLNPLDCQADFQQFTVSNQVISPEIRITSADPAAEVWLYGNLLNEWGGVNVDSAGSIRQEGMIAAQSVNISTGGSFIQNYVTGLYSTGGIPEENPHVQSAVEKFIQEMQGTEKSGETWSSEKKMELNLT